MIKSESEKCDVCGEPLDNPFAKNRGVHHDCKQKSDDYVEK